METIIKKPKIDPYYSALVQNNLPEDISSELQSVLMHYADEWTPRETYYLLKYSLEAIKNDKICYLLVSKKMDDLRRSRFFLRLEDHFTVERCKRRMEALLFATKESPDISKMAFKYATPTCLNSSVGGEAQYSLEAHITGILQDLLKCNKEIKDEFFATPEKFELILKYIRGDITSESMDTVCSVVDTFNQIIVDTTPEEAALCSSAERSIMKKELEQVESYEDFRDLVTYRMNLLDSDRVPRRSTLIGDEQLMTLWENLLTLSDVPQSPPNVEIPSVPRSSSLPPGDFSTSPLPLPPPPPSVPPMESTIPSSVTEPSEIETPSFVACTPRLSTPPSKDFPANDATSPSESGKKSRGRPKKSNLTLEIPPPIPTKKSRISSREPSETPKGSELKTSEFTPTSATPGSRSLSNRISSSASTPELGTASMVQSSTGRVLRTSQRRPDDLPVREARKRPPMFYTPTNSPNPHGSPARQTDDIHTGDNSQDSSKGSASRPGSSVPASAPQSARTSEERTKAEGRLVTRSMPLVKPEPDKKVVNEQTFLTIPYKVGTSADTKSTQKQKLKIYRKRGNISKEGGTRSQGTQTGTMYLENNFLRWNDATSKSSALAKSLLKSCYGPTSKYVREKTCKVHFSVERRSVIDLPVALRNHKHYDVIQQMKKLDLNDAYQLPARMVEPKYRRFVKKPMDQLTIKELMIQDKIKSPIDMALNCVLMCANHVVLNAVKKENKGLKAAQTTSLNVHQILRRMKD